MEKIGEICENRVSRIIEWKIKVFFSLFHAVNTRYDSPDFYFSGICWNLWIYPNGETINNSLGFINIYLARMSSGASVTLDFSIALKSTDRHKDIVEQAKSSIFDDVHIGKGFTKLISRLELTEMQRDMAPFDEITIICTMKNTLPNVTGIGKDKSIQTPSYLDGCSSLDYLSKDFTKLLNDGPNHDVEFTCGDQTIKAHKNILSCRSNVFTSMLQSDMLEGKRGEVNIQDIDAAIFQQFLRSLYTGALPKLLTIDDAMQLYQASDKYAVDTVKQQCADFLIDNLSLENACEILILADRHTDSAFKNDVLDYIFEEKIPINGEKWADFCIENQKLAIEVLNLFCQRLSQK